MNNFKQTVPKTISFLAFTFLQCLKSFNLANYSVLLLFCKNDGLFETENKVRCLKMSITLDQWFGIFTMMSITLDQWFGFYQNNDPRVAVIIYIRRALRTLVDLDDLFSLSSPRNSSLLEVIETFTSFEPKEPMWRHTKIRCDKIFYTNE